MRSEQIVPQFIVNIMDEKLGLIGHLVIDSTINGHSAGGVRMLQDVTVNEVIHLARNMTLKYGFWRIPVGGAKSCVFVSPTMPRKRRMQILSAFGKSLGPLIETKVYYPGFDMGASKLDLQCIFTAAGYYVNLSKQRVGTHVYTSWTMFAAARVAANHLGFDLGGSKIAIEGFGKVGSSAAQIFSDSEASIVAVSTREGAIYDPNGLDVPKLIELERKFGSNMVKIYKAKRISKSDLLCLPLDVLVPCARPWSINSSNVGKIRARIICPGANVPMTLEVERILHSRRILCLPDAVANSGGAFGGYVGFLVSEKRMKETVNVEFCRRVVEIIRLAEARNLTLGEVAREIAMKRFKKTKLEAEQDVFEKNLFKSVLKLLPKSVRMTLAPLYFRRRLKLF